MTSWLAQTADGSDLTGLATIITQLGLSAVFLWLYSQERKERQAAQATLAAFVEKHATVLHDAVEALEQIQKGMAVQVERAGASPLRTDLDVTLRRLELAADELGAQARRRERGG